LVYLLQKSFDSDAEGKQNKCGTVHYGNGNGNNNNNNNNNNTSKSFRKYLSNIPGKHEIKEVQKTATLGTAHILQ
jgi:hypothetical protein